MPDVVEGLPDFKGDGLSSGVLMPSIDGETALGVVNEEVDFRPSDADGLSLSKWIAPSSIVFPFTDADASLALFPT